MLSNTCKHLQTAWILLFCSFMPQPGDISQYSQSKLEWGLNTAIEPILRPERVLPKLNRSDNFQPSSGLILLLCWNLGAPSGITAERAIEQLVKLFLIISSSLLNIPYSVTSIAHLLEYICLRQMYSNKRCYNGIKRGMHKRVVLTLAFGK